MQEAGNERTRKLAYVSVPQRGMGGKARIVGRLEGSTVSVRPLHMASGLDMIGRLPAPRQQFVETVDGMSVDHPLQHVTQVGARFDVVELAGRDKRADHRPAMPTAVAPGEQVVLAAERDGTDRAFDGIGVELDAAIMQESRQPMPARERVADCFGERAATRHEPELRIQPDM